MIQAASPARRLGGRCLCGRLEYHVADEFLYAMYCHCSLCRRMTGSAFKALAGIERAKLVLRAAHDDVATFEGRDWHNVNRRHCGSLLYAVVRGGDYVHVAMGTLVDEPAIRPAMHAFVASKAPWYEITDGLPRFAGAPPPMTSTGARPGRDASGAAQPLHIKQAGAPTGARPEGSDDA